MSVDPKLLDKIATGEISVTLAAELIKSTLAELNETKAQKVYTVLRAWVWKALNERRRDSEIRKWHALINQTSSYLEDDFSVHAERIRVLHELVYETISVSDVYSFTKLSQRSHVREILIYLYRSPDRSLPRRVLEEKLGLTEQNMTRMLTILSTSGLLERSELGKSAIYSLTLHGTERARSIDSKLSITDEMPSNELAANRDPSPRINQQNLRNLRSALIAAHSSSHRHPAGQLRNRVQRRGKTDVRRTSQLKQREKSHE